MYTQAILLIVVLFGSGSRAKIDARVYECADLVEVNHFHDKETGKFAYTQVIYYEWSYDWNRYHVIAWYIPSALQEYPTVTSGGSYLSIRKHNDQEFWVWSQNMKVTWTTVDPERENKKLFDEKFRRRFGKFLY